MRTTIGTVTATRALRAALLSIGLALVASAVLATPAHAALTLTGPIDPALNFPAFYQDAAGLQLETCTAPDPLCPLAPTPAELNTEGGEGFYSLATATATGPVVNPGGQPASVQMKYAVEATFLGGPMTFGRVEVTLNNLKPNSTYTIVHPYGTGTWTTDANGRLVAGARAAARHQVGCPGPLPPGTTCDFNVALGTEIGPYLTWDPAQSAPPAGHIGDGVTPHTVVGSTNNSMTVTGPGLPAAGISTSLFVVMGRLAAPAVPVFFVAPGSGDFGTQRTLTTSSRTITVKNNGLAAMPAFASVTVGVSDFAMTTDSCTGVALASGASCTVVVSFSPVSVGDKTADLTFTDVNGGANVVPLTGTGGAPGVTTSPTIVNFLNVAVGTTSPAQNVTVTNSGTIALTVSGASISGVNASEFAIAAGSTCTGATLAVNGTCTIGVRFLPGADGARNASLDIASDAAGSPNSVSLTGTGTGAPPPPTLAPFATLTPTSLAFGPSQVGAGAGAAQTVQLTNTGTAPLSISAIALTGATTDFALPATATPCPIAPATLDVGAVCTIDATFAPTVAGARSASIAITDNGQGGVQTIALTGSGTAPPPPPPPPAAAVAIAPASLTFASQQVATTSTAQIVTLQNTGNADLGVTSIALTGANAGDYAQTNTCGATVPASTSCTISVTFTPTLTGARPAALTITDSAVGSPRTLPINGTGAAAPPAPAPAVTLTPTLLNFGSQQVVTTSAAQTVTLTNSGAATLNIAGIAVTGATGDFAQTHTCAATLAAGANCSFSVTFTPTTTGARTATITITDNAAGGSHTITLSGTGAAAPPAPAPAVALTPSVLSFGSVQAGTSSGAQTVTLTNTGNAALNIASIGLTGATTDYAQTNTCPATLNATASCTFSVTFTPTVAGARSAAIAITDNAPGGLHSITLSGTGTAAPPPAAPAVALAPSLLTFAATQINTTSAAQTVTLTNPGNAPLSITSVALTGANLADFAQTNTCGTAVAAAASCTFTVTFAPKTAGARSAAITILDNAAGGSHSIPLSGTATTNPPPPAPVLSLSGALSFGAQTVGTSSGSQAITLHNTGNAALAISGIARTGVDAASFAHTTTCGPSLAAAASCTITVTFNPTTTGAKTAAVTISDNALGAPHSVSLSGSGSPIAVLAVPAIGPSPAASPLASSSSAAAEAPLYVTELTSAKRIKRSRVKKSGLTVSMVVAPGTKQLQVHVMRKAKAASRQLVYASNVTPSATGAIKLRLRSAKLRSALKIGTYEVEITPARGAADLGTPAITSVRVVRG